MNSLFSRVKSGKLATIAFVFAALAFLLVFYGMAINNTPESNAVSALDFKAGRIIDDEVFYNPDTMTVSEIQAHLDKYSANCDMWGTNKIGYGRYINGKAVDPNITRREYARLMREAGRTDYHDAPYVCISKYYENPTTHKTNFETNAQPEEGMISAAQIIYDAAHTYNINPQVLLVMLKKESYVWGDTWPLKNEYNTVMGYACPDNAPCDSAYFGFYNQVMKAAWQLNYYKEHIYSYGYYPYMTNNIYYSPNYSCGTKAVYLENIATTSLYIYTPYTPNDAALANYPGEAYCGSYGNRNFFMYFSEWFGSTYFDNWEKMDEPRYLTVNKGSKIVNLSEHSMHDASYSQTLFFNYKASYGGDLCLKEEIDSSRCYLYSSISEYSPQWEPMITPRYLSPSSETHAIKSSSKALGDIVDKIDYYDERYITPDNTLCLRNSKTFKEGYCVLFDQLNEIKWDIIPMSYPRKLSVNNDTFFVNPITKSDAEPIEKGRVYYFDKQIIHPFYGQCLITDTIEGLCLPYNYTSEYVETLKTPTTLTVNTKTYKVNTETNSFLKEMPLDTSVTRLFLKRTYVRMSDYFGECYFTEYDINNNNPNCVRYDQLDEAIVYLESKRYMTVNKDTYKYYYKTGTLNYDYELDTSISRYFVAQTYVRENGHRNLCYFTEYDMEHKTNSCILADDLQ